MSNKNNHGYFRIFRPAWFHISLLIIVILYIFISPKIEGAYFLKEGKPIGKEASVTESTDQIECAIEKLHEAWWNGEKVWKVTGWSYLTTPADPSKYRVFLVLRSKNTDYVFETITSRTSVINISSDDKAIDVSKMEFFSHISKETLRMGIYELGLLYEDNETGERIYQSTNVMIQRTPNKLKLIKENGSS